MAAQLFTGVVKQHGQEFKAQTDLWAKLEANIESSLKKTGQAVGFQKEFGLDADLWKKAINVPRTK